MTRKILAALDGSRTSESILPYLESLLRSADANVTLARVTPGGLAKERDVAEEYLKGKAAALESKGACVDTLVLAGDPAGEIARAAVDGGYTLVLVCTRGKTGLKRLVMGSVAEELLRTSSAPVLVVHPIEKGAAAPRFCKIVVPLDGSHRSASILPAVADLAKATGAKVGFVTVVSPTKKDELPVEVVAENIFRNQRKFQKRGLEVEIAILYGDPAGEAIGFAERNHADLIAISTHGRSGLEKFRFGSVALKILRTTKFPLLVLRTVAELKASPVRSRAGLRAGRRALEVVGSVGEVKKGPYNR